MSGATQPLIIIGAPRSGTNMLRDALTALPRLGTWPCDEINYIWRHGNLDQPTDEFGRELARPDIRTYIRRRFERIAKREQCEIVVEKTCANSLRVGFVDEVFPDARFLYVVRDGVDVVGSAMLRWRAPLDIPYLLRKALYVPPSDLPHHALRYVANRWHRLHSTEHALASWGPRFEGLVEALANRTLAEVCALQWRACVRRAEEDLSTVDTRRVLRVCYEDFVRQPTLELRRVVHFLERDVTPGQIEHATMKISDHSIGKGRRNLDQRALERILPLIQTDLEHHGYAG